MKLKKMEIDLTTFEKYGLKPIKLYKLGNVLLFIGKNGAGKTRILDLVEETVSNSLTIEKLTDGTFIVIPENLLSRLNKIDDLCEYLEIKNIVNDLVKLRSRNPNNLDIKTKLDKNRILLKSIRDKNLEQKYFNKSPEEILMYINKLKDDVNNYLNVYKTDLLKKITNSDIRNIESILEKDDVSNDNFENLLSSIRNQDIGKNINEFYSIGYKIIKLLRQKLTEDKHISHDESDFQNTESYKTFVKFKELFEMFFNKPIELKFNNKVIETNSNIVTFSSECNLIVKGREFIFSEFSPGEKTIFSYVLLLFVMSLNSKISFKDSIILIDEPELHLHAEVEIEIISKMKELISEGGQLWIASHSINILSHMNYDEVYMVDGGEIFPPGKDRQIDALKKLVDSDEKRLKIADFLYSIEQWSYIQFMEQCFLDPEVIPLAPETDPQVKAVNEFIYNRYNNYQSEKVKILDFGAGKGRLFEALNRADEEFLYKFDFYTSDIDKTNNEYLKSLGVADVYNELDDLKDETFDIIIICNVLHEIKIDVWVETLNRLINSLKKGGYILILEANSLNKGEKIGGGGYLLLDEDELKYLFDYKKDLSPPTTSDLNNEKHTFVTFIKEEIKEITYEKLEQTMEVLKVRSLEKIKELRLIESTLNPGLSKKGRRLAFLSQLHINAIFALEKLNSK